MGFCLFQEALVSCWLQFSDGAVTPLALFDRGSYSLTVATPDEAVATVRRTPQSTFVVAQGEGGGGGAGTPVRVELRICEECQKSKRKSKLAVGVGQLRIHLQSSSTVSSTPTSTSTSTPTTTAAAADRNLEPSRAPDLTLELQTPPQRGVTAASPPGSTLTPAPTSSTSVEPELAGIGSSAGPSDQGRPGPENGLSGKGGSHGNKVEELGSRTHGDLQDRAEEEQTDAPTAIESDLIRTFGALSQLEVGVYALVGVSCLAILAFLLSCSSPSICVQAQKSPVQAGGDPQQHKHEWVWLGSSAPPPASAAQVSTLVLPVDHSQPERTATLGRTRTSSQQHFHAEPGGPVVTRSATLLARPQRSEPLHSPTSKRNQVQFTTFTTLDVKHLSALRNGVEQSWSQQNPAPVPLGDRPWPVVTPGGEAG